MTTYRAAAALREVSFCAGYDRDGPISAWTVAAAVCAGDDHDGSISAWTVAAEACCHGDDGRCYYELDGARASIGDCISWAGS